MNDKNKKIQNQLDDRDMKIENHETRITHLENKKKRIKCGGNGTRVTIADVLVEMRNGFNQVNYRLDNIETDVKDLKVRVTKLEDNFDDRVMKIVEANNVKLKAELKADMVQLLDERDVKLKNDMVKMLDERDKKWEAKFDEMNNSFEDKVVKILDKHLDERDKKWEAKFDEMNNGFEDKVVKVIKKFNDSQDK